MEVQNSLERLYSKSKAIHTVREIETKREREREREGEGVRELHRSDQRQATIHAKPCTNPHPNGQSD